MDIKIPSQSNGYQTRMDLFLKKKSANAETPTARPTQLINIYCDGSTYHNGKPYASGGIGIYFAPNDPKNVSEPFTEDIPTNQRTELYALIRTLMIVDTMIQDNPTIHYQFHIYTDSQYSLDCVTKWIPGWKKNNWITAQQRPVKNRQLIEQLDSLYTKHKRQVYLHHIDGHTDNGDAHSRGNAEADLLAKQGSQQHPKYHH